MALKGRRLQSIKCLVSAAGLYVKMRDSDQETFSTRRTSLLLRSGSRADLVVGVYKEVPFAAIHDGAGADSADLLAGVG